RESRQVARREAVAEGARDGEAELQVARGEADVAGGGDAGAAAGAGSGQRRYRRQRPALYRAQPLVDAPFGAKRVLRSLEATKLGDVGAGGKGLVAGAAQHQGASVALVRRGLADLRQALVHGEGERVARLRPVEGDDADAVFDFVEQFLAHERPTCRNTRPGTWGPPAHRCRLTALSRARR